jgi:hypothetical protein
VKESGSGLCAVVALVASTLFINCKILSELLDITMHFYGISETKGKFETLK